MEILQLVNRSRTPSISMTVKHKYISLLIELVKMYDN